MTDDVEIFEVGPRDGLQNEPNPIPTADKIALIDTLSGAGFKRIEVASFVSPKWVPQMADSAEVLAGIARAPGVRYAALTPNLKGYERAKAAKADEIAIFGAASEGFSRANINATIAESLDRFAPVAEAARADGMRMRGYVSCVTDCPYDGPTPPGKVAEVAERLLDLGCYEISLGDTIGQGTPETVTAMLRAVLTVVPAERLAGHFHDTGGRALENIEASLDLGLRVFDAAVGGLGGCPYAKGATGNVATEAVAERLNALGYRTGLDLETVRRAAAMARAMRGSQTEGQGHA
ncbi:Hydroxymethylglutaryl-CoA lyase [Rhodovulum sp. P5]|uniref:hydroxymethylglutaryl-CoA lyase n=1 Tax=Rhodovulum sp. P5 TaxID=1564506 RepID=UPI0009C2B183|nr:hydroxymethylglutaryl-CoA lyase [Rhodovulum sp. P5]ARE38578.1 Hydroxymethylglutaryl-CoA lyase [Rhodovulum sp. P5]